MLTLFLQGGDIEQESERSRPGKMHLQNGTMPCADPALLTHRIPSMSKRLLVALWRGLWDMGELGLLGLS